MSVQIIEQSVIGKHPDPRKCEDGLFISKDFVAVIDGVTSKGGISWGCPPMTGTPQGCPSITGTPQGCPSMTSGCYAREVLLAALQTMPADIDSVSAIEYLNLALAAAGQSRYEYLLDHPEERLQAVIILYSCLRREVWAFGDCQCLIDSVIHTHSKKIDCLLAQIRCLYDQAELLLGCTADELSEHDPGRDCILPLLRRQFMLANQDSPYGYDVLDGFAIHAHHVSVYPVAPKSHVILASDGYPVVRETLLETEEALKALIEKDPLCICENRGTKGLIKGNLSFDDRTYVRFLAV